MSKTQTRFADDAVVRATEPFFWGDELVRKDEERRGDDPAVRANPQLWVPFDESREKPGVIEKAGPKDIKAMEDFRQVAAANRRTLVAEPVLYRLSADVVCVVEGAPTTLAAGSTIVADDPLRHVEPALWELIEAK